MPCYHPISGFRSKDRNPSGKRSITFNKSEAFSDLPVELPCGQCIGCRLERSRQWATRCLHEASLYEENCFITLTYNEECIPPFGSLRKEDFTNFMKKLRREYPGYKIRYFQCGEYGEICAACGLPYIKHQSAEHKYEPTLGRPHHHAILFGFNFSDRVRWKGGDFPLDRSMMLEHIWQHGHSSVGEVTFESAAYVARYVTKKITGPQAADHYAVYDKDGTVLGFRIPEYITMSRRSGIGFEWFKKYSSETFRDDFVVVRGKKCRPPQVLL